MLPALSLAEMSELGFAGDVDQLSNFGKAQQCQLL